jgi:hypothetical protein
MAENVGSLMMYWLQSNSPGCASCIGGEGSLAYSV